MDDTNVFPDEVHTSRLVIRVAKPGDGARFNQAIVDSIDSLRPWLSWVTPIPSLKDSETSCRQAYARFLLNQDLMAFLLLKSGGELVGVSGLHYANWTLRQFEVGYWGHSAYLGRGLIREGVAALTQYAMNRLAANRVCIYTDERNLRSSHLAEQVGFSWEGTLRRDRRDASGAWRNTRVYALVRNEVP